MKANNTVIQSHHLRQFTLDGRVKFYSVTQALIGEFDERLRHYNNGSDSFSLIELINERLDIKAVAPEPLVADYEQDPEYYQAEAEQQFSELVNAMSPWQQRMAERGVPSRGVGGRYN